MKEVIIKNIIDYHLNKRIKNELNKLPGHIEIEMSDIEQDKREEWRIWFPIDSKVVDYEIEELANKIGYKLPKDYIQFLKYKHFYDLHISEVSFCSHPINKWKSKLIEMVFDSCPTEYLIKKGYIPFADWSDWGILCFDTNRNHEDNNYPIVLWDHEIEDEVKYKYKDFYDFMLKIDKIERENINPHSS